MKATKYILDYFVKHAQSNDTYAKKNQLKTALSAMFRDIFPCNLPNEKNFFLKLISLIYYLKSRLWHFYCWLKRERIRN